MLSWHMVQELSVYYSDVLWALVVPLASTISIAMTMVIAATLVASPTTTTHTDIVTATTTTKNIITLVITLMGMARIKKDETSLPFCLQLCGDNQQQM